LSTNAMEKLKGNYRRHRFLSLAAVEAGERGELDPFQQGYEEGLRQGQERGLEQGLDDGRRQGEAQGYEIGYKNGLAQGQAAGQEAFAAAMAPLAHIQRALEELRRQDLHEHTEHLCALVEQVARRVIHAELSLNPHQLQKLVEDALSRMDTRKDDLTIFVSTDDYQRLAKTGTNRIGGFPVQADNTLAIGDCRLESEHQQQTVSSEERLQNCVTKVREELTEDQAQEQSQEREQNQAHAHEQGQGQEHNQERAQEPSQEQNLDDLQRAAGQTWGQP
jgi:flagellar assembly protein FliH